MPATKQLYAELLDVKGQPVPGASRNPIDSKGKVQFGVGGKRHQEFTVGTVQIFESKDAEESAFEVELRTFKSLMSGDKLVISGLDTFAAPPTYPDQLTRDEIVNAAARELAESRGGSITEWVEVVWRSIR